MTRRPPFACALLVPVLLAGAAVADARRTRHRPDDAQLVALLGTVDLALSSGARWLRHPSLAEPWAAVTDEPASLDVEPAGALIGPPGDVALEGAGTRRP